MKKMKKMKNKLNTKITNNIKILMLVLCGSFFLAQITYAQEDKSDAQEGQSQSDIEKAAQNPVAAMISVPFQDNIDFGVGPDKRIKNTMNIQPVIPFSVGSKFNIISRTIIPIITQPTTNGDGSEGNTFGLGDITASFFLTSSKPKKVIWGVGTALGIPTATKEVLGSEKWSAGPALVILTQPKGWTLGLILQNTWSYAGNSARQDVNFFYSQIFITKNLKAGWYLNSAPIITANWNDTDGEPWSVPLGAGAGRVFSIGNMPVNAQVGYYYYVVQHQNGAESQLRLQFNLLFPKGS
jgi:hypothetical protein